MGLSPIHETKQLLWPLLGWICAINILEGLSYFKFSFNSISDEWKEIKWCSWCWSPHAAHLGLMMYFVTSRWSVVQNGDFLHNRSEQLDTHKFKHCYFHGWINPHFQIALLSLQCVQCFYDRTLHVPDLLKGYFTHISIKHARGVCIGLVVKMHWHNVIVAGMLCCILYRMPPPPRYIHVSCLYLYCHYQ